MASSSAVQGTNSTLAASTVDTVLLTGSGSSVKVTNLTGTAPIYFTVGTPGGACPAPTTAGGPGTFYAASVAGNATNVRVNAIFGAVVQLISTGTPAYAVELQSSHATS